ncbi:uncharacterized protein BDZ99DRAFT_171832 [Mytilinidion resinicola]|uniref:Uncharacterized protein n=1 Tax=Mytilinidion resinicola TaxID=574789 RepID=A0A6A6Y3H8_9PEZI|nr:uncharacterized protein BDZ99DRAFT_171832 [Mytilinidion resinicola]KAF2803391.1 hypothetical protein BDZ99DRAFT_171832 [Mytilinidion resinicola]
MHLRKYRRSQLSNMRYFRGLIMLVVALLCVFILTSLKQTIKKVSREPYSPPSDHLPPIDNLKVDLQNISQRLLHPRAWPPPALSDGRFDELACKGAKMLEAMAASDDEAAKILGLPSTIVKWNDFSDLKK